MGLFDDTNQEDQSLTQPVQGQLFGDQNTGNELRVIAGAGADTTPEQATKILQLQEKTGLPRDFIARNLDLVSRETEKFGFDATKFAKDNPVLSKWLSEHPDHYAAAKDDLRNLSDTEWLLQAPKRAWKMGQMQEELQNLRMAQLNGQVLTPDQENRIKEIKAEQQNTDYGSDSFLGGAYTGAVEYLPQLIAQNVRGLQAAGHVAGATAAAALVFPEAAPVLAAASPLLLSAGYYAGITHEGFRMEAAGAYDEYLGFKDENGKPIDPKVAKIAAYTAGMLNAGIEATQMHLLIKTIPGLDKIVNNGFGRAYVAKALQNPSALKALTKMAAEYGGTLTLESAQEAVQRFITIMSGELAKSASGQKFEHRGVGDIATDISNEFVGALKSFAFVVAPGTLATGAREVNMARQARQQQQFFEALGEKAQNSKVRERLPQKYQEVVDRLTKDGPIENVYTSTEFFQKHFRDQGVDPEKAAKELGIDKQYQEAIDTGSKIAIPTQIYARKIAPTEHNQAFAENLSTGADVMSAKETQDYLSSKEPKVQEPSAFEDSVMRVSQDIRRQLSDIYPPATANKYATLYEARIRTRATRLNMDPWQLYQERPLSVSRETLGTGGQVYQQIPTEKVQLRKPEFKKWFGESQVKDENNIPKVVYHGTGGDFSSFSSDFMYAGEGASQSGSGFYFTDNPESASNYAALAAQKGLPGNVMPVYLSIKNPLKIDFRTGEVSGADITLTRQQVKKIIMSVPDIKGPDSPLMNFGDIEYEGFANVLRDAIDAYAGSNNLAALRNDFFGDNHDLWLRSLAAATGHDGAVSITDNGDHHWVAWFPEQIKSAVGNVGTFDVTNPNILYQRVRPRESKKGLIRLNKDGSINIELLKDADLSTFLHETGHLWLEEMVIDATRPGAPAQITEDLDAILKHIGVKATAADGIDKIREQLQEANHETFARTVEQYFMEGKAPSSALRRAFAAFKAWLVSIYKSMVPGTKLNNQVRQVMDRMVATDEEIQNAKTEGAVSPLFATAEEMGVSPEQFKAYQKTVEEASAEAQQKLEQKLIKEYQREQTKIWKQERKAVVDQVTQQVDSQPVYKAMAELRNPNGVKINRKSLIEATYGGKDIVKQIPNAMLDNQGAPPDMAAEMLGYSSGEALINEIINARDRKELINAEADRIMFERHGDTMLDGTLHEKAREAVHNELRGEVIIAEIKALNKKAKEVQPFLKAKQREEQQAARAGRDIYRTLVPKLADVRQDAKNRIANKTLRQIRPYDYFTAARKASRNAIEAMRKEDYLTAAHNKGVELLSMEMFREANRVKADIQKSLSKLQKTFVSDIKQAKTKNIDMINAARAILAAHGIGRTEANAMEFLDKIRRYDPDMYENMRDIIEPVMNTAKDYRDMTYDEFVGLRDSVLGLVFNARRSKQIQIEGKLLERDQVVSELVNRIGVFKGRKKAGYDRAMTQWEKTKQGLLGVKAILRRVEFWADAMDGGNPDGVFRRYIWTPISEAVEMYREQKKEYIKKYLDTVKIIEQSLSHEKIEAPEINYTFKGKLELLHAILHTGNESNLSKLLRGRGWGELDENGKLNTARWDQFVERMMDQGILKKEDYVFAQGVWDLMEELKPMSQKAHHDMYGYYFDEIAANPIENRFGTFRGGYIPAIIDPDIVNDAAVRRDAEELINGQNSFAFPTTGRGATMKRVENYARPLQLDMRTIPAHIDWALRFANIEPAVKDIGRLVIDKDFRAALDAHDPSAARHMLTPWLQRTARQSVVTPGMVPLVDKFWSEIRKRTGLQIMVANVINTLQQFTGLSIAKTKVRPGYLRDAFWQYLTNHEEVVNQITERSRFMKNRVFAQTIEIQKQIDDLLLNPTKYEKVRDFANKHGYFMQAGTQNIVDKITWMAAYNDAIEQGYTEKSASLHADSVVRETQGSFAPEDISRAEAGTPFLRAFMMFYNYFNMQANLLGTEFSNIITNNFGLRKGAGRAFYLYFFGFMIPAFVGDGIIRGLIAGTPDDGENGYLDDYLSMFFGTQVRALGAMIPVAGPVINYAWSRYGEQKSYYNDHITSSPVISTIESAVNTPGSVYKAIKGKGSEKRAVKDVLNLLGILTGMPFGALSRPAGYLADVHQGKAKPKNPDDVIRGLVSGQDVNRSQ